MTYSINWLLDLYQQEKAIKYLFFWGHQPRRDGQIGPTSLSQWWDQHPFTHEDQHYRTAEHWMMAGKARLFDDEEMLAKILECETPGEAKKLGRKVRNFDQATWEMHRFDIVVQGNILKFGQHDDLKSFLLNTGDRVLVEASPLDRIWGIGLGKDHPSAHHPDQWKGLNLLGFALMEARDDLNNHA